MTTAEAELRRLRVTFDDQVFALQRRGGISRYFTELLRIFRSDAALGVEVATPFRYVVNEHLLELDPGRYRRAPLPAVAQRDRVLRPLNRLVSRSAGPSGILHHTYYLPDALERPAAVRVCTVYDMMPEVLPELFGPHNPHRAKRQYVQACDAILCISQTTKDDLLTVYGDLDKPVVVTPLGVAPHFFGQSPRAEGADDYVLYVGQRAGYKNFDVLLRAFGHLAPAHPALTLQCVGPPFDAAESAQIDSLGLLPRVAQVVASDDELPGLYAGATCFVFPSRYEGFGLPIVEAFAAGCPVLLAETPCCVEVGGAAAQYFAPDDDETLATRIGAFVSEPSGRDPWVALGRERAKQFTWEHTAELTSQVYRSVTAGV